MSDETTVLVLGDHGSALSNLADRVRAMSFRAVRAKTPEDAIELARERGFRYSVALIEPDLPAVDLRAAFEELRHRSGSHELVVVATGPPPEGDVREALRDAGIDLALWLPVTDNALLFQLNSACTREQVAALREDQRVPTNWTTRVMVAGRAKRASLYSLSAGGAYLATERPSLRGAELAIDLPLPAGAVSVLGRVIYTNVPGNLHRARVPSGMGVRFLRTPPDDRERIGSSVAEVAADYFV